MPLSDKVVGYTCVVRVFFSVVVCCVVAGCGTARGLADDGKLREACLALDEDASPLVDDDGPALASRVRQRLPGSVSARVVDVSAHVGSDGPPLMAHADLVEIVVDANAFSYVGAVTAVDSAGTQVPAPRLDERTLLAMFGAPSPPPSRIVSSTHTPGVFEQLMDVVGMVTVGLPISLITLGAVSPDLNGTFSSGPSTSSYEQESPELPAWRARADVLAAARLGHALGVDGDDCALGRCRFVVVVNHAAAFSSVTFPAELDFDGCRLHDTLTVPLSTTTMTTTTPLAQTPPDTQQWARFQRTGFGIYPVLNDIGDDVSDCCDRPQDCGKSVCSW